MKERIERLKAIAENIVAAKYGKRGENIHINSYTVISEYHEWRAGAEDLFYHYFDDSNPQFYEFKSLPQNGNGYTLINYFDQQYPIFKILIEKIETGQVMNKKSPDSEPISEIPKPLKTIFISHSVNDREIAIAFVDLIILGGIGVPIDQVFCVSTDGTKIKSGKDWRDDIKDSLTSAKIIILIITPNYKESEFCLCEMGAAWMTSAQVLPLIVEPINYKTVGVIQEPNQVEKLLEEQGLDRIKDIIQEELRIPSTIAKSDRWTNKKKEFISTVNRYLRKNRFQLPLDRVVFNKLQKDNTELSSAIDNLISERSDLENLLNEIVKVKDREAAEKVLQKHRPKSFYEELLRLATEGNKILIVFSPIIREIIFKSFTGKNITINWESYRSEIDEGLAKDYITDDLEADWETTPEMQRIYSVLVDLSDLISRDLEQGFYKKFAEDFNAPLKINNITFWENVFKITLRI